MPPSARKFASTPLPPAPPEATSKAPRIVYLCASPIALSDGVAAPALDLQAEFERVVEVPPLPLPSQLHTTVCTQAAKSASCAVELAFAYGTAQALTDQLATGCGALHYSGHGMTSSTGEQVLAFEDGRGGTMPMGCNQLRSAAGCWLHAPEQCRRSLLQVCPLRLAVVSACSGEDAGRAFVAAGVPHVVVTRRAHRLQDKVRERTASRPAC